jgi:hypothetical protein
MSSLTVSVWNSGILVQLPDGRALNAVPSVNSVVLITCNYQMLRIACAVLFVYGPSVLPTCIVDSLSYRIYVLMPSFQ